MAGSGMVLCIADDGMILSTACQRLLKRHNLGWLSSLPLRQIPGVSARPVIDLANKLAAGSANFIAARCTNCYGVACILQYFSKRADSGIG
jgi:hypothetical protein